MRLSNLRKRAAVTVAAASIAIPTFMTVSPADAQDAVDAEASVDTDTYAVDAEAQATIAAADPAPQCVDTIYHSHTFNKDVHLHNQCKSRVRVKVVVAFGPDSQCFNLSKGGTATHWWAVGWPYFMSRFDALVLC